MQQHIIELDGQQVEAFPLGDNEFVIKGTKPDRLTMIGSDPSIRFPDIFTTRAPGLAAVADAGWAPILEQAFDHFWPGWRTRVLQPHTRKSPEPPKESSPIDRFEANVRHQWRPTEAHDVDTERLQELCDDIGDLVASSVAAEILKKSIFQGKDYEDVDTGDIMDAEARKCERAMARLDVENRHHVACAHALLGLLGEAYEVLVDWDRPDRLKLELGDMLFYVTALAHLQGMTLEQVMDANVKKLTERFPNGWQTTNHSTEGTK
jgi:NTP pyrophosphatase (non-canonical NTP hydrolase)